MPRPFALTAALALVASTPSADVAAQVLSPVERFAFRSPSMDESGLGQRGSVAILGDLTGDGAVEILAGAAAEDGGAGRLYVLDGATGEALRAYVSPADVEQEGLGAAAAGPGDLDGDGSPDAVVGAPRADPGGVSGAGRVYAISVADNRVLWAAFSPNAERGGAFGIELAVVPDVDGDGVDEVAVAATEEAGVDDGTREEDAGRAYLLSGATGALLQSLAPLRPDDEFGNPGEARGSDLGFSLGATTDASGRGVWLAGAPGEWEKDFDVDSDVYSGRLYVVQGDGTLGRYASPNTQNQGSFGHAVAGLPDLDGDGFGDALASAVGESPMPGGDDAGQVYLVSGATGRPVRRYVSPTSPNKSSFGAVVAAVPDVTGDGVPDHLATEVSLCCEKTDALYVFDAASGGLAASVEVPNALFNVHAAVGVPDLDADGRGEVAVGIRAGQLDKVDFVVVVPVASAEAEREPNDALASPQVLTGPSPLVVRGVVGGGDLGFDGPRLLVADGESAEDLFVVETTAAGLDVALSGFAAGEDDDVDLYVLDPETLAVLGAAVTRGSPERVALPALPAGRYLIAVDFYGSFGDASNEFDYAFYELRVEGQFTRGVDAEGGPDVPFALDAPFPNPARGPVRLAYEVAAPGPVRLAVFDALGREVAVLADGPAAVGRHTATVEADALAPGVYWVRLEAVGQAHARSFVVAR